MRADCLQRERRLAAIATAQHGVIAHGQLFALGYGRGAIRRRLAAGRLHRIHAGVYAAGHARLTVQGRWMSAVLAYGPRALLSHRDGAALWELLPIGGSRIHVTVEARGVRRRRGIAVHETRHLHADDLAIRDGIPVTSLPRTLLDLAEVVPAGTLARAYDQAERLRLLDVRAVTALCDRSPGRHGLKPLGALLADRTRPAPETKGELEALFFDFCRANRLPLPACNAMVEGFEVDAVWPAHRLIVELDSWEFHRGKMAFERDRERDAILQAAGYRVIRITWRKLHDQPADIAALLRRLMGRA
jgi:very-short-patch-repair endonuclease